MEPPAWAKRLHAAQSGYLFLDELSTSPPAVEAAMLGVTLERRVGDLFLPESRAGGCRRNPPERAADGWDLTPPLANRFLHVAYTPAVDGWIDGMTAGFSLPAPGRVAERSRERSAVARASVAAFIRCRPGLLDACPSNPAASGRAWPSRRTWTMTADVLALLDDDDTEAAHLAACGLVGEGAAIEYLTWRREADLPDTGPGGGRSDQRRLAIAGSVAHLGHPGRRRWLQHRPRHRRSLAGGLGSAGGRRRDGQRRCGRGVRPLVAHRPPTECPSATRGARVHRRAE